MSSQLAMLVRWTKFTRRRCQFEVQERDGREEEEDESDRRAGDVSAVDNGSKAAVPVGGSGNNMRGKIKRVEPSLSRSTTKMWSCAASSYLTAGA